MERRFKGKWNPGMLVAYCWGITKKGKTTLHTRGLEGQKLFKMTGVCF